MAKGVDLRLRCSCGSVRAVVRGAGPSTVCRVKCGCSGCQQFARALGRDSEMLDELGCTEVFQVSPADVEITTGEDDVACLQQTPKGAYRFYARCCKTALFNTLPGLRYPFIALQRSIIEEDEASAAVDAQLGPLRARVNTRMPRDQRAAERATGWALAGMLAHMFPRFAWWTLRGDAKRFPVPVPERPLPTSP